MSTQGAFGQILLEIAKTQGDFADRIMTTAPDGKPRCGACGAQELV
jgi:pyruvate dehydrogenase complex dehydrogenase (E1) component